VEVILKKAAETLSDLTRVSLFYPVMSYLHVTKTIKAPEFFHLVDSLGLPEGKRFMEAL